MRDRIWAFAVRIPTKRSQFASSGDIYFTDQGQTGLHDPTGRVYRLSPEGRLDCLQPRQVDKGA